MIAGAPGVAISLLTYVLLVLFMVQVETYRAFRRGLWTAKLWKKVLFLLAQVIAIVIALVLQVIAVLYGLQWLEIAGKKAGEGSLLFMLSSHVKETMVQVSPALALTPLVILAVAIMFLYILRWRFAKEE